MDYSRYLWESDFMYNEMIGIDYEDISEEENFVVGVYRLSDFPNVVLYINMDKHEVIEVYIDEEEAEF